MRKIIFRGKKMKGNEWISKIKNRNQLHIANECNR